jgi:tetratricopeptide (TPR) repeat protein
MARYELGLMKDALKDVEDTLAQLPATGNRKEATDLKEKIEQALKKDAPVEAPSTTKPASPSAKAGKKDQPPPLSPDCRRIEVVEASGSDSEPSDEEEPFPEVKIDKTVQGIEAAKNLANEKFAAGRVDEAVAQLSKCLWLVDTKRVEDLPSNLHSILYSNRALANTKLEKWKSVVEDCNKALALNGQNIKAKFRRAVAYFELGDVDTASSEVEEALKVLVDPNTNKEAVALQKRIADHRAASKKAANTPADPPRSGAQKGSDDSFEPASSFQGAKPGYVFKTGDRGLGYYLDPKQQKKGDSKSDSKAQEPADKIEKQIQKGLAAATMSKMPSPAELGVKAADDSKDEAFPEVKVVQSKAGIEQAKDRGNKLFAEGSIEESIKWFSKCIWLLGNDTKLVKDIPPDLHSILHSNRAFAYLKLKRWQEAEDDSSKALTFNKLNKKARHRRSIARLELGKMEAALQDADDLLAEFGDDAMYEKNRQEVQELRLRILECLPKLTYSSGPHCGDATSLPDNTDVSRLPEEPEEFADVHIEYTKNGLVQAREKANALFSKGSLEESSRCFSKCLWAIESGRIPEAAGDTEWLHSQKTALYSNRAFANLKLSRWEDAESDCSLSLALCPTGTKPLYRRAQARIELGKHALALEDLESALKQQPGNADLVALRDRTREKLQATEKVKEKPAPLKVVSEVEPSPSPVATQSSSPTASPKASPSAARGRGRVAAAVRAVPAPSVPKQGPQNSAELLRHFHSMKRHPEVLARYVRERVPPSIIFKLFAKAPIEPDDLATLLSAIRTSLNLAEDRIEPEVVAEYLQQLLRTRTADIQFGMLSNAEKEVVRELLAVIPSSLPACSKIQASFRELLC